MSHLSTRARRSGATDDTAAAAGASGSLSKVNERTVERIVNSVLREKLPGLVKGAVEEAIQQQRENEMEGNKEQMEALPRKVEELERSNENRPPNVTPAENTKKRGLYETIDDMRIHQHGEIKMKVGG